ncbi:MAG: PaaI family thioesterase [bacterium]
MENEKTIQQLSREISGEPYGRIFGFRLKDLQPGYALVEMDVTERLRNSLGMVHGGAIFSLIDQAFQAAGNSHGTVAVALNMNISYFRAPKFGDVLSAEAKEINLTRRTGSYVIEVRDQEGQLIANCQAMVYRKDNPLPFLNQ